MEQQKWMYYNHKNSIPIGLIFFIQTKKSGEMSSTKNANQ